MSPCGDHNLGFIGGGNMATAIGEAIIKKGLLKPSQIWVSGPHIERLSNWKKHGANTTIYNGEVLKNCPVVFICVKPHLLNDAIHGILESKLSAEFTENKLFVSILAGTNIETLKNALAVFENSRIIRTMCNTPVMLGEGTTVYTPDKRATDEDCQLIEKIFGCAGICHRVPESLINATGALAGSGPAFVYLMIEAMSDGGVKLGLPRSMATQFAAQTVLGAAKMVLETGKHTGQLKDEVCSPGGSSICGIHELEKGGTRASIINAIQAASDRSRAMGEQNK